MILKENAIWYERENLLAIGTNLNNDYIGYWISDDDEYMPLIFSYNYSFVNKIFWELYPINIPSLLVGEEEKAKQFLLDFLEIVENYRAFI